MIFNRNPEIIISPEIKLAGIHILMSLSEDKTVMLWRQFMPQRNRIGNRNSSDLFDVQIYKPKIDFGSFNENTVFEKWVAVDVSDFGSVPDGIETLEIPEGKYAVFYHKGTASDSFKIVRFIYEEWLMSSAFTLDNRPHFQILKEGYKPDDESSEEYLWVPVV